MQALEWAALKLTCNRTVVVFNLLHWNSAKSWIWKKWITCLSLVLFFRIQSYSSKFTNSLKILIACSIYIVLRLCNTWITWPPEKNRSFHFETYSIHICLFTGIKLEFGPTINLEIFSSIWNRKCIIIIKIKQYHIRTQCVLFCRNRHLITFIQLDSYAKIALL